MCIIVRLCSDDHKKPEDFATAILDSTGKKKSPNRLMVDEAVNDDNSVVTLSPKKVREP